MRCDCPSYADTGPSQFLRINKRTNLKFLATAFLESIKPGIFVFGPFRHLGGAVLPLENSPTHPLKKSERIKLQKKAQNMWIVCVCQLPFSSCHLPVNKRQYKIRACALLPPLPQTTASTTTILMSSTVPLPLLLLPMMPLLMANSWRCCSAPGRSDPGGSLINCAGAAQ